MTLTIQRRHVAAESEFAMGDMIMASEVLKATRIDGERLNRLIDDAEAAFWESLARSVPEARTGDLPPDVAAAFTASAREAVKAWLLANVHPTPTTGGISVRVELRRPRAGERGWWVVDDSSPEAALREVVRESEELGFTIDATDPNFWPAFSDYDEDGMRIVTVIVNEALTPAQAWNRLEDLP